MNNMNFIAKLYLYKDSLKAILTHFSLTQLTF